MSRQSNLHSSGNKDAEDLQSALSRVLKSLIFHDGPPPWLAELPVSQLRCWYTIAENEGLRMHDLSLSLGVKLPAISQIVDRLVRRNLIERKSDPTDRRAVRLYLTEEIRERHLESKSAHLAKVAETSSHLARASREALVEGLNQLADAAEALNTKVRPASNGERIVEHISRSARKKTEPGHRILNREMSPAVPMTVK